MSRRHAALKPQLNRIRAWAHEGSTDAWIAHQLDTTAETVRAFRQEHGIERGGPAPLAPITPDSVVEAMLAEEAAALEAGPEPEEPAVVVESEPDPKPAPKRRTRQRVSAATPDEAPEESPPDAGDAAVEERAPGEQEPAAARAKGSSRRRGTRGGAGRKAAIAAAEEAEAPPLAAAGEAATRDGAESAGEDDPAPSGRKRRRRGRGRGTPRGLEARLLPGSVLLLDPSVTSDPTFQEHWAEIGALRVEIGPDAIVLRRATEAIPDGPSERD
jgi:hypothetical protein